MEAHIRADDGVKKDAQHPLAPVARTKEGQSWTIPDNLDPDKIILEYLSEQRTSGIAERYGVRRAALTRWMQQQRPKEWKEVQIIRATCVKEDGIEEVYDSTSGLQLARARALLASAEFDLVALDKNYAPKQEVTVVEEVKIEFTLGTEAAALLDQLRTVSVAETPKSTAASPELPFIPDQKSVSD